MTTLTLTPGDTWTPTRSGSRAKARTVIKRPARISLDLCCDSVFWSERGWEVCAALPAHFRRWVKSHRAVRTRSGAAP